MKYILDPEKCVIYRIKLSGLSTTGARFLYCRPKNRDLEQVLARNSAVLMNTGFGLTVDLHLSKTLFSLHPHNLQLHCFVGLGALFCCSVDQPCKTETLQRVQVTPGSIPINSPHFVSPCPLKEAFSIKAKPVTILSTSNTRLNISVLVTVNLDARCSFSELDWSRSKYLTKKKS